MRSFNFLAHLAHARRLTAEAGGKSGGETAPKQTLEEQLTSARSELDTLKPQVTSLTAARDKAVSDLTAAQAENTRLEAQFTEATNTATAAIASRDKALADLATMTADRDAHQTRASKAETNVTRLETLCGVKGIDPKSAIPAIEQPNSEEKTLTRAAFDKLTPAAKSEFSRKGGKITD